MSSRVSIGAGLLLCAAGFAASNAPAATSPSVTPTPIRPRPVTSPGNADWAPDFEHARLRASAQQKLVFVEFTKKECGNCARMESLLYPAFDFEALLIPMVPVKLDSSTGEGADIARHFRVQDVPSIVIATPEGRLVFLMQGFRNTQEFYGHVHTDLDTYRRFARRVDGQDVKTLDAQEALETGRELYQRLDPAAAVPRLERASRAPGGSPSVRDEALELEAAAELDLGQAAKSRATIERLLATTKDSDRLERAALFRAQIPLAENRPDEALALFRAFRKQHPKSKYAARVEDMIRKLQEPAKP